jgi:hypothetical protein
VEASGTPTPRSDPPQAPPPEPRASGDEGKASGGVRALAVILVIVLAVAALFTGALAVVGADSVDCGDLEAIAEKQFENPGEDVTCYNGDIARVAAIGLGGIATVVLVIAALMALALAITGSRTLQARAIRLATVGVAIGALAYLIAAID